MTSGPSDADIVALEGLPPQTPLLLCSWGSRRYLTTKTDMVGLLSDIALRAGRTQRARLTSRALSFAVATSTSPSHGRTIWPAPAARETGIGSTW